MKFYTLQCQRSSKITVRDHTVLIACVLTPCRLRWLFSWREMSKGIYPRDLKSIFLKNPQKCIRFRSPVEFYNTTFSSMKMTLPGIIPCRPAIGGFYSSNHFKSQTVFYTAKTLVALNHVVSMFRRKTADPDTRPETSHRDPRAIPHSQLRTVCISYA